MAQIDQTHIINAPIDKVWWALTTAEGAEQWGAGPAKMNPTDGGEFSYWNGDIHGTNTEVIPMMLLKQDWYGHDDPTKLYKVTFKFFSPNTTTTEVHLTHSGEHDDIKKDEADWQDYYFDPLKKALER
ncbi:MAG: Activator of Hsp90 ATPase 1 family protein [Candidatus Saccharibacteria bacterium]|nr:Activator of Hsp90 ATPase 1 family protein [Candidatus Saccharibacteria bacterium]